MTPRQEKLWEQIQAAKADPGHDKAGLKRLVKQMVDEDDIVSDLRAGEAKDPRACVGRSIQFGKFRRDDEDLLV